MLQAGGESGRELLWSLFKQNEMCASSIRIKTRIASFFQSLLVSRHRLLRCFDVLLLIS